MQLNRLLPALVAGLLLAALPSAAAATEDDLPPFLATPTHPGFADNSGDCLDVSGSFNQGGGVFLDWEAAEGAASYTIYRASEYDIDFAVYAVIDAANDTHFTDLDVEVGVLYGYAVTVDGADVWECEEILVAINTEGTCLSAGYCPPCPEPVAVALPEGGVQLEWQADERVVEWAILRATDPEGEYELVTLLEGNLTTYTDMDVESGETYYYLMGGLSTDGVAGFCEEPIAVTAVPFFGAGVLGIALAGVGAVGALVVMRRRV